MATLETKIRNMNHDKVCKLLLGDLEIASNLDIFYGRFRLGGIVGF